MGITEGDSDFQGGTEKLNSKASESKVTIAKKITSTV